MAVDYNSFGKEFAKSRKGMKWEEIDYFIDNHISSPSFSVLDIGCGSGRLLEIFKGRGLQCNYTGIDLSSVLLTEAQDNHKEATFKELNMLDIDSLEGKFDYIFFIASFHHLDNPKDREEVLNKAKKLLKEDGKIFMTNWALSSGNNYERYKKSIVENSENEFGGLDYKIKFGEYLRYYHAFTVEELNHLFESTSYNVIENRLFDSQKNFISVIS